MHWRAYGKYNGKGTVFAMKIINKHNFWGVVCTIYAMLSLGKILLEAVFQNVFGNDQKNLLTMFFYHLRQPLYYHSTTGFSNIRCCSVLRCSICF